MSNETGGRLDEAIDRAVRGIMQVDPRPGLRNRVAERLHAPARRNWTVPAFAAVAAMIALVVALGVLRTPETRPPAEPRVVSAPPAAPAVPPSSPQAEPAPQNTSGPLPGRSERLRLRTTESIFGPRTGRISAASLASDAAADDVPEAAAELPESQLLPAAIAPISPIVIAPITVPPIRIQPLTLGPVRDQR
jgi:hypothetical protein